MTATCHFEERNDEGSLDLVQLPYASSCIRERPARLALRSKAGGSLASLGMTLLLLTCNFDF